MAQTYVCSSCSKRFLSTSALTEHFVGTHLSNGQPDQAMVEGQNEPQNPPPPEPVVAEPVPKPEPVVAEPDPVVLERIPEPPEPVIVEPEPAPDQGPPLEVLVNSLVDIRDHLRKLRGEDTRLVEQIAQQVGKPGDYEAGGIAFTVSTSRRRSDWQGRDIVERLAGFLADELSVDPESGEVLPPGALVAAVVDVVADVGGLYRPSHGWPTKKLAEHGISADSYSTQGEPKPAVRLLGESGQEPW